MSVRRTAAAAIALAVLAPLAPAAHAAPSSPTGAISTKKLPRPERPKDVKQRDHAPRALLVEFKSGASASARDHALRSRGGKVLETIKGTRFTKASAKGADIAALAQSLKRDPAVRSVAYDLPRKASVTPNDPGYTYGDQPYLNTVRLPQAWDRTKGSTTQVIAVVDTGVNVAHEDLVGRTVGGLNAITNVATAATTSTDDNGHGTMVAGIAAANTGNGIGIAGAAWTARVMPIKALDSDGWGWDSDIAQGVVWAADHGAKVINLSVGGPGNNPVLSDAVKYATGKGSVIVAAAGNDGDDTPQFPAAYPEVIAVGATDTAGRLTDFSTHGDWVDVAAPGFGIVAPGLGQDYFYVDGTSFSSPLVAGTAALVRTAYPTMTPAQVRARILATARDAGPRGIDQYYGYGVLDAYNAVGGTWGSEFPMPSPGAGEPNNLPAKATAFTGSALGSLGMQGDVDWYRYDSTTQQAVSLTVTAPAFDAAIGQNSDPMLAVYDASLRLMGDVDAGGPGDPEKLSVRLGAGTYYVAVRNYNGAADPRTYSLALAQERATTVAFDPYTSTAMPSWPETVTVGDATGDGLDDVVMTTSTYFDADNDNKLFVFAQQPGGSLATTPVRYTPAEGASPHGAVMLDVDGDGREDVVTPTVAGVQVFRQGDGGVLDAPTVVPDTLGASAIVAGDLNADKDPDLILSTTDGLKVLTHQADGSFTVSPVSADQAGELEVGDLDGDGRTDIATFSGSTVRVYHQGDASWTRTDHPTGSSSYTSGIEVTDASGDGRSDVVVTAGGNRPASVVSVLAQNDAGGLDPAALHPVVDIPEPVEAGLIDDDSRPDVVAVHGGWNALSVLPGTAGALGDPLVYALPYASHYNPQGLALGDVNGDGRTDAVVADYNNGLVVLRNSSGPTPGGAQDWVSDASPAEWSTGVAQSAAPTVKFVRALDPASVTTATVRLVHGRTGSTVASTVSYDAATDTVTIKPAATLQDNTPYRIVVDGVADTSGERIFDPFTSTFRTVDTNPGAVTGFKATGANKAATLSWGLPSLSDLDQVIVRMAVGTTAPASVTSGTGVYAGTGTGVTVSNLAGGTTYTFRAWVKDRSGKYSPGVAATLAGVNVAVGSSTTALTYGGSVTVTGRLTRADNGAAIAATPVQLYARRKGSTTWSLIATPTTTSTGYLSYVHKPAWSLDYMWMYRGSSTFVGTTSAYRLVGVRTAVSANLSKTSFALGGSVALSGSVAPSHAGQTVYLQRYVSGAWKSVASKTLSSTSTYSFTIKPSTRGSYYYRVYKPADADHLSNVSATKLFKVS